MSRETSLLTCFPSGVPQSLCLVGEITLAMVLDVFLVVISQPS